MKDGLYTVTFATPLGEGAGVVVKVGSQLLGGDTAFAWAGALQVSGSSAEGHLDVVKHSGLMSSVFGPLEQFALKFTGTVTDEGGNLSATSPDAPGVSMAITLKYLAS